MLIPRIFREPLHRPSSLQALRDYRRAAFENNWNEQPLREAIRERAEERHRPPPH